MRWPDSGDYRRHAAEAITRPGPPDPGKRCLRCRARPRPVRPPCQAPAQARRGGMYSSTGRLVHGLYQDASHYRAGAAVIAPSRAYGAAVPCARPRRARPGEGRPGPVGKRGPCDGLARAAGQAAPRSARGRPYGPVPACRALGRGSKWTATLPPKLCPTTTTGRRPARPGRVPPTRRTRGWTMARAARGRHRGRAGPVQRHRGLEDLVEVVVVPAPAVQREDPGPPVPYLAPHRRPPAKVLSAMSSGRQTTRRPVASDTGSAARAAMPPVGGCVLRAAASAPCLLVACQCLRVRRHQAAAVAPWRRRDVARALCDQPKLG